MFLHKDSDILPLHVMAICRIVLKEQGEREMRDGQRERVGEIERDRDRDREDMADRLNPQEHEL